MRRTRTGLASRREDPRWQLFGLLLLFALLALLASGGSASAAPVPGDPCPNGDVRLQQGVTYLPSCMALEQVSPVGKRNASAAFGTPPTFSSDGQRIRFDSFGGFGDPPSSTALFNEFIATRGGTGWDTKSAGPPKQYVAGSRGTGQPFAFAPDLSHWAFAGMTPSMVRAGIGQAFLNGLDDLLIPRSPLLFPLTGGTRALNLEGASGSLDLIAFSPSQNLTAAAKTTSFLPGDPQPAPFLATTFFNTYVAQVDALGVPSLMLLARDGGGKVWGGNCGAAVGGIATGAGNAKHTVGAVSSHPAGGYRIWLSTRPTQPATGNCSTANKLRILERTETPTGPQIVEIASECDRVAPACVTTPDVDDYFQGAALDGAKIFFRTARQLADSDTDAPGSCTITVETAFNSPGCDLYLYDSEAPPGERLTQVSAGDDPESLSFGNGADVLGVTAISGDGSHVYFVAKGVLTATAGPEGGAPVAGQPNLYLYQRDEENPEGRTAFVGVLDAANCSSGAVANFDCAMLWGNYSSRPAQALPILGAGPEDTETGGDGHLLVFASRAPLTADDEDGTAADLFRYDAEAHELVRISKAAPSCSVPLCGSDPGNDPALGVGRKFDDSGTAAGPAYAQGEYTGRLASENGETIAFTTQEPLVPYDDDGAANVYLWREGELYKLPAPVDRSGGVNPTPFSTVSQDGSQVAYTSFTPILPGDGDTAKDVYVARVGGGFLLPPPPVGCDPHDPGEKGCLGPQTSPPADPSAGTSAFTGRGNLEVVRKPAKPCGKRKVRRKGRCVASKPKKQKRSKRLDFAADDRRGA